MRLSTLFLLLATLLYATPGMAVAQDAEPAPVEAGASDAEPVDVPEPQIFEFHTAGFEFSFAVPYEPVVRESSNSSIYAVSIQRRAADGLALSTDGAMPFVRLTQTIDALSTVGTADQLLNATVTDALKAIKSAYGDDHEMKFADCSTEILGEERHGKRITIGVLPNGVTAYAECYAIELENGTGVGITLKMHEPLGDEVASDVLLATEIVSSLEINDLEPSTTYFYSMAGYPIALPVRSRIEQTRKVNSYVFESNIALEKGTLRVQLINVPQGYDPKETAGDQITGYSRTLEQQRDQGQLKLEWSSPTTLPGGAQSEGVVRGKCFVLTANGNRYYNAIYSAVDGNIVIAANFTGNIDYAADLSNNAEDFFNRPISELNRPVFPVSYSGHQLDLSMDMMFAPMPAEAGMPQDEYFVSVSGGVTPRTVLGAPVRHRGYTHIKLMYPGDQLSLEDAHRGLCERESGRFSTGSGANALPEPTASEVTLEDGRAVRSLLSAIELPLSDELRAELGTESATVTIRSYLLEGDEHLPGQVVSTIAGAVVFHDLDATTRSLLGRFGAMPQKGVELAFGQLELIPYGSFVRAQPLGMRSGIVQSTRLTAGGDTVSIVTYGDDARHSTLSKRLLAEQYLRPAWDSVTYANERELYPVESNGLDEVELGGHHGLMFQRELDMPTDTDGVVRTNPEIVRVVGLAHGDSYSVITIRQYGEHDPERVDQLMGLIQARLEE